MQQMTAERYDQGRQLQQAHDIIRQLQTGKDTEDPDPDLHRQERSNYMLRQLQTIANAWVREIGDARGFHDAGLSPLRVYLFTYGSFRLQVDDSSSDVDVLVMVPAMVDRSTDFFGPLGQEQAQPAQKCASLLARLRQDERVQHLVAVPDAYVPCIKMSFGGVEFDLTFANVLRDDPVCCW